VNAFVAYIRRIRTALIRMRVRGYSSPLSVLVYLPRMMLLRAYRIFARHANRSGVFRTLNRHRLRRLHATWPASGGHFYVIVMPGTLHFLLPCLALLPRDLRVALIGNGEADWERRLVHERHPELPFCSLARLPATSVTHGDVITLLLLESASNFGLVDHDCFVFDSRIFAAVEPGPRDCLTAIYGGVSAKTGLPYPETYLLFLNVTVLKDLMARYHVDARIYRNVPASLKDKLATVGMGGGVYVKDDRTFFDTLHLLLALAYADGIACHFVQGFGKEAIAHVGGTSWKASETKELIDCYVDWRFLDFVDDDELRRRYRHRTRPFRSAAEVRAAIPMTPEAFATVAWIDALIDRLAASTARSVIGRATAASTTTAAVS